jgi:hypothetical protein
MFKNAFDRVKGWFSRKRRATIDKSEAEAEAKKYAEAKAAYAKMFGSVTKSVVEGGYFDENKLEKQAEFFKKGMQEILYWIVEDTKIIATVQQFLTKGKMLENLKLCYGK